ncbi:Uchl3 [Symbiodinium pilosum]|uniref:Ubiquitin carboxyl-terminal hydrolase n=1 Tax=Symbiodinium pilosum TaxID=2952 RepID=A0A812IU78_SYMPI|nr:Uchl3 [Symbiodinium pilosum]
MPLESNPKVVGKYVKKLGFDSQYEVHELLSLEPWALEMIPRPAGAVFLLFPQGKELAAAQEAESLSATATPPTGVIHMKQLVGNACGTIAVVHAMANLCKHSGAIATQGSWLERFLANYKDGMTSEDLGTMLEEDVAIEAAHDEAERESEASHGHATNKDLHFIVFVCIDGLVVELDGCKDKPIVRGKLGDYGGDFLRAAVVVIRERYMNVSPDPMRFNMMALCKPGEFAEGVPSAISEEAVAQLMALGFDADAAKSALEAAGGNAEEAANFLLG